MPATMEQLDISVGSMGNTGRDPNPTQKTSDQKQTFDALLSITSAAVEALEKPKIPQRLDSVGIRFPANVQKSPVGTVKLTEVECGLSGHSKVSSPNTLQNSSADISDNVSIGSKSSTASEILVRTTNTDPGMHQLNLSNASRISNNSKVSTTSSTFLTGDAKKVKISSKKLKEIKSPFEDSNEQRSTNTVNMGFFKMLDNSSLLNSPSKVSDKSASFEADTTAKQSLGDMKKSSNCKGCYL